MTKHRLRIAALGATVLLQWQSARASAAECARVGRENLTSCALGASLAAQAERRTLEAFAAREETASTILPGNPVLSGWLARRTTSGERPALNWSATLAQEVEIGGQRGARRRESAFGRAAQTEVVRATNRDVVAAAWRAYFETIAAREQLALMKELATTARRVSDAAQGAAARGLVAGVDADVADAGLVAVENALLEREQKVREATAALNMALGLPPSRAVVVEGALEPLSIAEELDTENLGRRAAERPEVRALRAEARADLARADVFRRQRVPNPTISAFVERDGFSEHVLGVGLAFPIPLPHPLGHTFSGEIAESEALAQAAGTRAAQTEREATMNAARATAAYDAAKRRAALYGAERTNRARDTLAKMAGEIEAGRLAIRDAVVAQEALIDLLLAGLVANEDLCVTSVELARAAGVALEKGVK